MLITIPGEFEVDEVQAPDWNDSPYDNLVLPPGEKDLLIAFADRHQVRKTGFDDFVRHKGMDLEREHDRTN